MALSDIGLCSRALLRVGSLPISSFADGTAQSEIAGLLYGPVRDALLSSYGWSFATRQAELERLTDVPLADFSSCYAMPPGVLRVLSAGSGGHGHGLRYRISGQRLETSSDHVLLTYIQRPDESAFPPYFDLALIARLAAEFCLPLTENTSRAELLTRLAESAFSQARQIDAQQDSPNRITRFSLIDARS